MRLSRDAGQGQYGVIVGLCYGIAHAVKSHTFSAGIDDALIDIRMRFL